MSPDDPRHGSEAGHEQHNRDGEEACGPCYTGKILAARRRSKRKLMGVAYTVSSDEAVARIQVWRNAGATYTEIADHVGLTDSRVWEVANDKTPRIYTRTAAAVASAGPWPVTAISTTRRLQALTRLGYTIPKIAAASGVHHDTVMEARKGAREFLTRKVRTGVAEGYEQLHMTLPTATNRQESAGITRARNYATRHGWLPPLAYDLIDDLTEQPSGWEYQPTDRTELLLELIDLGMGLTEACRRMHLSADTLQKWCSRNALAPAYRTLAAREQLHPNQHTDPWAAVRVLDTDDQEVA